MKTATVLTLLLLLLALSFAAADEAAPPAPEVGASAETADVNVEDNAGEIKSCITRIDLRV
jgi:hypothetical protein